MIVGVDARTLQTSRGVWRYLSRSLQALVAAFPEAEFRLLAPGDRPLLDPPQGPNVSIARPPGSSTRYFARSAVLGRPQLDQALGSDLSVFWSPASNAGSVSKRTPWVVTVHDLSFHLRPQDFTPWDRRNHWLTRPRHQAERARRVVADTAVVAAELVEHWDIPAAKIDVIRPGIEPAAWPAGTALEDQIRRVREHYDLPPTYFLQVGALEPRKQPVLMAHAHQEADTDSVLVFAGAGRLEAELREFDRVRLLGWVPDDHLDLLYAGAKALCYPSLLEGYGFPPLEAALRGTPSIISDIPVLHDVLATDAAAFVAPADRSGFRKALERAAHDDAWRQETVTAARACVEPHTWQATAEGLMASFEAASGIVAPRRAVAR